MANTETVSSGSGKAHGTHTYLGDDPTSNYYLHHGDSPGAILVSQPLYNAWVREWIDSAASR